MTLLVENVYISSNNDPNYNPIPNLKNEKIIKKNLFLTITLIFGVRTQERYRA